MKAFRILLAALLAAATGTALAHTDEELAKRTPPNGGELRMTTSYHLELVLARDSKEPRDNPVVLHVTDHDDKKIDTRGASGTVTLLGKNVKATIELKPDGDNRLRGVGRYASDADIRAVVSITVAGGKAEQARFTPLAPRPAAVQKPAASSPHTHKH